MSTVFRAPGNLEHTFCGRHHRPSARRGIDHRQDHRGVGDDQLFYVRIPDYVKRVQVGREADFSVRADVMHTGEHPDMANRIEGTFITTEFKGSLETDVFEIGPNMFVNVEQHRGLSDRIYEMGEREVICWQADSGVLLEQQP